MTSEHIPQIPSRQSESNAIGSAPRSIRPSFTTSSISRNDMSGLTCVASYVSKPPALFALFCRQTLRVRFIELPKRDLELSFIAPRAHVHLFVTQRFLVQHRGFVRALVLPRGDVGEMFVVALGFAVGRLIFRPEMAAARFVAV